jgi:hypothetical protein
VNPFLGDSTAVGIYLYLLVPKHCQHQFRTTRRYGRAQRDLVGPTTSRPLLKAAWAAKHQGMNRPTKPHGLILVDTEAGWPSPPQTSSTNPITVNRAVIVVKILHNSET